MPEAYDELMEILAHAREPLQGHAGHGVHRGGGQPLHAPDAQREAARRRRRCASRSTPSRRGCSTSAEAIATIDAGALDALLHPGFERDADFDVLAEGVAASPGAAKGAIVFTADDAVAGRRGRPRRDPRAPVHRGRRRGRLPRRQGHPHEPRAARRATPRWSRAGWASRACPAPRALDIDLHAQDASASNGTTLSEGDLIAIDGSAGHRHGRRRAARGARGRRDQFETVLGWADELRTARRAHQRRHARGRQPRARVRRRGHRPLPHRAHVHGRGPPAEDARDDHGRDRGGPPRRARRAAAAPAGGLRGAVRGDGGPAGDDPAARPAAARVPAAGRGGRAGRRAGAHRAAPTTSRSSSTRSTAIHSLAETNPMLGTRGVRLGILHPEIYEMQVRAIVRAALAVAPRPAAELEIMIPLVAYEQRARADARAGRARRPTRRAPATSTTRVGTMIELPRACFVANRIAEHADFFSFGTNDLTQTALGFSRDDVEGRFLEPLHGDARSSTAARSRRSTSPGGLARPPGAWTGREAKPDLKLASAASTAAIPSRSPSSTWPGSTT